MGDMNFLSDAATPCSLCLTLIPNDIINEHLGWCQKRVNCPVCGSLVHSDEASDHLDFQCNLFKDGSNYCNHDTEKSPFVDSSRPIISSLHAFSRPELDSPESKSFLFKKPTSPSEDIILSKRATVLFSPGVGVSATRELHDYEISSEIQDMVSLAVATKYKCSLYTQAALFIQRYYRAYRLRERFKSLKAVDSTETHDKFPWTLNSEDSRDMLAYQSHITDRLFHNHHHFRLFHNHLLSQVAASDSNGYHHLSPDISSSPCVSKERSGRLLRAGIHKFNRSPKRGIHFLVQKGFLPDACPLEIALFLKSQTGLSRTAIGDFLGDPQLLSCMVLCEYVQTFDVKNAVIDVALRKFLNLFRLPGEAQKIDRIMEAFAKHFCSWNPSDFNHPDTAYVLAFSIIMLNTDLHNPNVKRKMTKDEFIRNNRGIDNGHNLPPEFLSDIYQRILQAEFITMDDHSVEVARIISSIAKCPNLVAPHRYFVTKIHVHEVKQSELRRAHHARKHPRILFLFNDVLLCVKSQRRTSDNQILFSFKSSYSLYSHRLQISHSQNNQEAFMLLNQTKVVCMFFFKEKVFADKFLLQLHGCFEEIQTLEQDRIMNLEKVTLQRPWRTTISGEPRLCYSPSPKSNLNLLDESYFTHSPGNSLESNNEEKGDLHIPSDWQRLHSF
eukprot:Sdes_comp9851_c0_seq1m1396